MKQNTPTRFYLYLSGFMSAFLITAWLMSFFMEISRNYIFLAAGLLIFFAIYLPLLLHKRKQHKERMQEIINDYKQQSEADEMPQNDEQKAKGWSMNSSPFRDRKSGLEWGGGNIKASEASRGTRKRFLKK